MAIEHGGAESTDAAGGPADVGTAVTTAAVFGRAATAPAGPDAPAPGPCGGTVLEFDPRYLCFFDRFNAGDHFAAHDVLEHLWLEVRREPVGNFYKGLIQLAGAFVHVRKGRDQPALRLLDLARERLSPYADLHEGLDLGKTRRAIAAWRALVADNRHHPGWLDRAERPHLPRPSHPDSAGQHAAGEVTKAAARHVEPS